MQTQRKRRVYLFFSLALLLTLIVTSIGSAQEHGITADPDGNVTVSGEIGLGAESIKFVAAPESSLAALEVAALSVIVTFDETVDAAALEAISGGQVVHQYSKVFNGASIVLSPDKLDALDALEGVTGIYLDELQQLDTETSPDFIGAPTIWNQLGGQGSAGEGVIVGILDSGIWPEHPSMADDGSMPAPPVVPGSNGFGSGGPRSTCDFGNQAWNVNDAPFTCNNKLIGAYSFLDTYKAVRGLLPTEFDSARDDNGHGNHTATTAAGNGNVAAALFGVGRGNVSGIAPRAHVIAYRVCGDTGCFQSDSVRAVEQAILDGVDAINFSISGGGSPYNDAVEQAFSVAYDNGVFVSASAGNAGPGPETVAHRGPWTMTVGASTTDRHFLSTATLTADNGDTFSFTGASVTAGIHTDTPVVFPPFDPLCLNPYPAGTFSGEIVICQRGVIARVAKSFNVASGGAGGLFLYNPVPQGLSTDNHYIPSIHIENDDGADLLAFMGSHSGVTATFTDSAATTVQGDVMAPFSSRGGPLQPLGISKPDVTAPGVQILAGNTPMPATADGGAPGELFQAIQGTSMSSPHVAGAGALLKALHPDWTPGQIKSALMMSANPNHFKEDGVTPADPFDFGSGRIDLNVAGDVLLTMDESRANYMALQDELWNSNYPSIYHPSLAGKITLQRTVHNELSKDRIWFMYTMAEDGLVLDAPRYIKVPADGDKTFDIDIDARAIPAGEVRHGAVVLYRGGQYLHIPVSIVGGEDDIIVEKVCDPLTVAAGDSFDCTITIQNNAEQDANVSMVDAMPWPLSPIGPSVVGGTKVLNKVVWDGTLAGAAPPVLAINPEPAPFGFFPLASLGVAPFGLPSNPDDGAFVLNVPAFEYLGETHTQVIWSVNGTIEAGTSSGLAASAGNTNLPAASLPNNLIAPWWTDLDLSAGGAWYVATLTAGPNQFLVFEWQDVPRWGDNSSTFSFQIWIQTGTDNIWFAYDDFQGSTGDGTVGAENNDGTIGAAYYYDGVGTNPWGGSDLRVAAIPGAAGGSHEISFSVRTKAPGSWTNCAVVEADILQTDPVSCVSGEVLP